MGIKTFEAPTLGEAKAIVENKMGKNAYILSATARRWFSAKGGWETLVEVTATSDYSME